MKNLRSKNSFGLEYLINDYESVAKKVVKECEKELGHEIYVLYWRINKKNVFGGMSSPESYFITVPYPKDEFSLYILLHELGHLFYKDKYKCLKEYRASQFALDKLIENNIIVSSKLINQHISYIINCLNRAIKHGLKSIPQELLPYKEYLDKTSLCNQK